MPSRIALAAGATFAVLVLLGVDPAEAAPKQSASVGRANDSGDGLHFENPGASSPGEPGDTGSSTKRVRRGGSGKRVAPHVIRKDRIKSTDETGPGCIATDVTRRETPMNYHEGNTNDLTRRLGEAIGFENCPRSAAGAGAAEPTPAQVAEAFVRQVPLPLPEPAIAPDGQAITGLAAFLETNGALAHAAGEPTPLGAVEVQASGAYFVDWGDGSPEAGPFSFEGEAYPTGRIWHHYIHTGAYTATLRTAWTATWRLGGDSGVVEGLATEASTSVEVFQVQAVIRR